jgi:hypothetical protein
MLKKKKKYRIIKVIKFRISLILIPKVDLIKIKFHKTKMALVVNKINKYNLKHYQKVI